MANIGGIMGLCMGCSLVTIFEVGHHVVLIFLKTGKKSVSRIQKTIKLTNERTGDIIMRRASSGASGRSGSSRRRQSRAAPPAAAQGGREEGRITCGMLASCVKGRSAGIWVVSNSPFEASVPPKTMQL